VAEAVNRVLELDQRWRAVTAELEQLRAEQNRASRGRRGAPTPEEHEQLAALAAKGRELSDRESLLRAERDAVLASLPNLTADDAPDEDEVLREVGEAGKTGRDHLELAGPRIDVEHGARTSGSRFAYLRGELVMLELALIRYAFEKLDPQGFEPVIPPVLVREQALYGSGFLPDTEQQIYRLADDDLYLAGTSEVALASLPRSTNGCWRSRNRSSRSSRFPTAWSRSPSAISAHRRRRNTTARVGYPARGGTAS
jgi:seryl-tRNA synthetase